MILPIVTVFVTVSAGAALALVPKAHGAVVGHIRTFALTAAAGVVLMHFLPHALEGIGLWALLLTAAGLAIPHLLEQTVSRVVARTRSSVRIGLEAGYAGLLAHKVGDGFALAAAEPEGPAAMLAIGAHTVPVVAFVVLAFGDSQGRRAGLLRAVWLALASVAGILSYRAVSPETLASMTPVFDSLVAGLLLHVVAHELGHDLPETAAGRALDIAAAAAGLAVIGLASLLGEESAHGHGAQDATQELGYSLLEFALASAPMLLLALIVGALLRLLTRAPAGPSPAGSVLGQALAGIWRALFACVCACRVFSGVRGPGTEGSAFTAAFVLAAPALALDGMVLTAGLFGVPFALGRASAGAVAALASGVALAWLTSRRSAELSARDGDPATASEHSMLPVSTRLSDRLLSTRRELQRQAFHVSAWVLIGLLLGAQIRAFSPVMGASFGSTVLQAVGLGLVALLTRPCLPAAALVAAALASRGAAPGALLTALVLASIMGQAGFSFFGRFGVRVPLLVAVLSSGVAFVAGLAFEASGYGAGAVPLAAQEPSLLAWFCLAALLAIAANAPWRAGVRGWLAAAFELEEPRGPAAAGPAACGCRSHAAGTAEL